LLTRIASHGGDHAVIRTKRQAKLCEDASSYLRLPEAGNPLPTRSRRRPPKHIARTFGVSRWKKFGIIRHTTVTSGKAPAVNVPRIHEEMPFGIGMAFRR
jgi:hypothetical protein